MSGLGHLPAGRDENLEQTLRLTAHPLLRSSESLCKLLRYLAEHSLHNAGATIKEYQIATEVFGRPADFDPRLDSTVRVQASRLRAKLAEYYAGDGAGDRIVVEIPKGAYCLTFRRRDTAEHGRDPGPPTPRLRVPHWWLLASVPGFLAVILVAWASRSNSGVAPGATAPAEPLYSFWRPFLNEPEGPLVIYSNAEFVGRPQTGMRYFDPRLDSTESILDLYTGVGEVMAIYELDRVFSAFNRSLRVKRGRLLAWDDAKNANLIFIGPPSENPSLRDMPATQDFVFRARDTADRPFNLSIVNLRPGPGEQSRFDAPERLPITEDFAVVALLPGLTANRRMLILAGTTTLGTQAAVEYVCRPAMLEDLLRQLGGTAGERALFEAVLRVKVNGGVPVQSQLAALHPWREAPR